jgi:hypothetical protein
MRREDRTMKTEYFIFVGNFMMTVKSDCHEYLSLGLPTTIDAQYRTPCVLKEWNSR